MGRKVRGGSVKQCKRWKRGRAVEHTSEPFNPNSGFSLCSHVDGEGALSTEGDRLHGSPDGDKLMSSALLRAAPLALHRT